MQNIDYVEITNHLYEKGGKTETPEFHTIFFFIERREGEDLFPVLWFHSYEHLSRRKQKKINKPHEDSMFTFRVPSWNGTANYLILCMWTLVPCGGEHCSPVSRIKSTLKDNSSCPSSRRAQPEEKGGCSNCILLQFSERPGDRAQRWSTTPSLYLLRGTLGFSCRKG